MAPVKKKSGTKAESEPRISVRIPKNSDLKARLIAAAKKVDLDEPNLVLRCVEATVDYIERHGELTLPLVVMPKSQADKITPISAEPELRVAEEPPKFKGKRKGG